MIPEADDEDVAPPLSKPWYLSPLMRRGAGVAALGVLLCAHAVGVKLPGPLDNSENLTDLLFGIAAVAGGISVMVRRKRLGDDPAHPTIAAVTLTKRG